MGDDHVDGIDRLDDVVYRLRRRMGTDLIVVHRSSRVGVGVRVERATGHLYERRTGIRGEEVEQSLGAACDGNFRPCDRYFAGSENRLRICELRDSGDGGMIISECFPQRGCPTDETD